MKFGISILLLSIILLASCGKPAPEEYVGKATVAINEKNFALAIEEFEKLIKDLPDSPQAEEAMFTIAKIQSDELKDFPKAIAAYKRYLEKYPNGSQAPLAVFMTGYIFHNELHDLDNARSTFESYLSKYPDHEMVPSARFELENLGRPPEEILPNLQEKTPVTAAQASSKPPTKKN
ncbi:MAG: tetratricopeptide repeat protein [Bacteroidetes bacterium]|nr:tetratricopeptide repeat protein [Bacteroidota bacterium]MCW5894023.1 tetratricopeptide repeat protein [Bacteroidota bacterium]